MQRTITAEKSRKAAKTDFRMTLTPVAIRTGFLQNSRLAKNRIWIFLWKVQYITVGSIRSLGFDQNSRVFLSELKSEPNITGII
jgi:hypothetical protein